MEKALYLIYTKSYSTREWP